MTDTTENAVIEIMSFFRKGGTDIRKEEPSIFGPHTLAAVAARHWGKWEIPAGEEDDGDYDWEVLSRESAVTLRAFVESLKKKYPTIDFYTDISEKNWITIVVANK